MPLNREGTLTADEVYALTAYLLSINQVIPEDQVLDRESLPKVKMPLGEGDTRSCPTGSRTRGSGLPSEWRFRGLRVPRRRRNAVAPAKNLASAGFRTARDHTVMTWRSFI